MLTHACHQPVTPPVVESQLSLIPPYLAGLIRLTRPWTDFAGARLGAVFIGAWVGNGNKRFRFDRPVNLA